MPIDKDEYDKLVTKLNDDHSPEVVALVDLSRMAAMLCPTTGHQVHVLIAETIRCYCVVHSIQLDQLRACATDLDKMLETVAILNAAPDESVRPGVFCQMLLDKIAQKPA